MTFVVLWVVHASPLIVRRRYHPHGTPAHTFPTSDVVSTHRILQTVSNSVRKRTDIHWYVSEDAVSYRGIDGTRMGSVGIYVVFRYCDFYGVHVAKMHGQRIWGSLVQGMGMIVRKNRMQGYLVTTGLLRSSSFLLGM